eukprot:TRINITY_DN1995_c0_g1_i8.p1 TRINITY_DN1995_c0_g1~~TRINITY_DN1995_c0_g1_i8.p1  ORF type:complete len:1007 (-),score=91.81 TRINITY_DN1995_c0_g1_i8:524-3544(-)
MAWHFAMPILLHICIYSVFKPSGYTFYLLFCERQALVTMFLRIFKTAIFLVIIGCRFFYWCHGCLEEERTHLLQIKDSINYPHGSSLDEAWVEKDCCNWDGIECNSSRVISISLFSKREERLGVWYPNASLFVPFKELEQLYLGGNQIGGWVTPQAFSKMQSLRNLYLGRNNLSAGINSLRGLCELKNLQVLSLEDNNLDGRVLPPCLSNLSMLEELSLSDNDLGPYSSALTALSGMRSLKLLDLSSNNLSGGTDSLRGLCELKNLQDLHLEKNNLDGRALPPCLSNLSMLKNLRLSGNDLGSYSSALTGICKLPALRLLDLSGNRLNDHSIPKCLGNLSLLEKLYLSHNELRGSFSSLTGLCELSALGTLYLDNNYLTSLPICMGNFSSLERLILQGNNLSSLFGNSVPGLKRLLVLNLGSNLLTDDSISPWIYNLTSLTVLELSNNTLRGSNTMRGFCNLRNLEELDIEGNSFECSLHPCFGNMHRLSTLNLPHNKFRGTIPPSIFSNLTMLASISISQNQFSGLMSFSNFANLSELLFVDLSENTQLEVETESPTWVPTFQLYHLLLNNCILNKRSNNDIPSFISTQHVLETLNLGHTFLQGTIPSWLFYNFTVEYLNLKGNSLEGPFPKSIGYNNSMLHELDISNNKISGELPPNMGALFPNLVLLNISTNELRGAIPLSVSELQNLKTLDLSQNKLSGQMPQGLTRNTSLKFLKLSNNKLQGNVVSKFSNMTELVVLLLDNNNFTGTITSFMLTSPSLIILDLRENNLSGSIPNWLGSLVNLALLLLGRNFFDGSIPPELCQLQNLHILDLSNNKISGSIPHCLSNISSWMTEAPIQIDESLGPQFEHLMEKGTISSMDQPYTRMKTNLTVKGTMLTYEGLPFSLMTGIDLSMNQLINSIPFEMGNLKQLRFLNLSHNILSGHFPDSFQNLGNIESLDLSHNQLVGMIPAQIVRLYSLSIFNVAFNNLSGAYEANLVLSNVLVLFIFCIFYSLLIMSMLYL